MKLLNKTDKDLTVHVRVPMNESGVYRPVYHLVVKMGESKDIPEHAVEGAKMMGMVVKAEEGSVSGVVVETKQISESSKVDVEVDTNATKKLSEEEVYAMNKKEQMDLLKKLGAEKVPRFEKDRVSLILELEAK